jgi:hypothetical protein
MLYIHWRSAGTKRPAGESLGDFVLAAQNCLAKKAREYPAAETAGRICYKNISEHHEVHRSLGRTEMLHVAAL